MVIEATAGYALILLLAAGVYWGWHWLESRVERLQQGTAHLERLGEKVLQARGVREVDDLLRRALSEGRLKLRVRGYYYRRSLRRLETLDGDTAIDIHAPQGETAAAVAAAFRNRTMDAEDGHVLVPMLAGEETLGVLELTGMALRWLDDDALQHLGNLAGIAVRQSEQAIAQEQTFRTEKVATAAQFVQAVVTELKAVAGESPRAQALAERLLAMARSDSEPQAIDVRELLNDLFERRHPRWLELHVVGPTRLTGPGVLEVFGSRAQLEQVFVLLLECAEDAGGSVLEVSAEQQSRRVKVDIRFTSKVKAAQIRDGRFGLAQATLRAMGAEVRLVEGTQMRFEAELPAYLPAGPLPEAGRKQRTALVVEADAQERWRIVEMLAKQEIRAVPVETAGDAEDRLRQFDFDWVLCPYPGVAGEGFRQILLHDAGSVGDGGLEKPVREEKLRALVGVS